MKEEQAMQESMNSDCSKESVPKQMRATNLLMISNKRQRSFYERAARELLASGHEYIALSALGEAIPLAVQLAYVLQSKNAAIIHQIKTKLVDLQPTQNERTSSNSNYMCTSGVTINLKRHINFKGTRIVPNFVLFCPNDLKVHKAYPQHPNLVFASVNYSTGKTCFDSNCTGLDFCEALSQNGFDIDALDKLSEYLLRESLIPNEFETEMKQISFVGELEPIRDLHKDLKAAFCRVCPYLKDIPGKSALGSVYIFVFDDAKRPYNNELNSCMVHVVAPSVKEFPNAAEFLEAVTLTATNLMTALCDFNGYTRRCVDKTRFKRLAVVRIPLISGDKVSIHPETTREDVARAIIQGLDQGYHFGPAPRLNFYDSDKTFQNVWMDLTGQPESALQIGDEQFRNTEKKSESKKIT